MFARNCATCHGDRGRGPAGPALDPLPTDVVKAPYPYGTADWQLMRTVTEGVPNTGMAGWDHRLYEEDAWAVVLYVQSIHHP